jgi:glycosyltransferase involved in cell wall biosynthesis
MKIIIVSYGHLSSGLTLAKHLSSKVDITFILVVHGDRFEREIINIDLKRLKYGLITDRKMLNSLMPNEIISYINTSFNLYLLHVPHLKVLRDWKLQNLTYCYELYRYIKNNNFDVVHFNGSSGFQLYFDILLFTRAKVYTIHDYIQHSGEEGGLQLPLNFLHSRFNYQFIQHSTKLREDFIRFYRVRPERVHAIYNGPLDIYLQFKKEEIKEEPFTILFFGRISKYKGIKYLIEAADIIKKEISNIKIIIAGKGEMSLDKNIDKKTFEMHNHYIDTHTLITYIQRCSLVVLPYTDATQSAALLTAYAFEKPVVATCVGGIPELVWEGVTGKLVPPKNPQRLAEAIVDLLKHPHQRRYMSEGIRNKFRTGEFAWEEIVNKLIKIYSKITK